MHLRHPLKLFCRNRRFVLPVRQLRKVTTALYREEKISPSRTVNCICCSDYMVRKLNRNYRKKDKVTDVLSFPFDEHDLLGEIYISLDRTVIQAHRFCIDARDEFRRLYIHGLLHLAGYDHIKKADRGVMAAKERLFFDI